MIHAHNSQVPPPPPPPPLLPPPPVSNDTSGGDKGANRQGSMADRARLAKIEQPEEPLKCPRCESTNTKFCYYNNYSLTQPRHFCKTCRRYWTRGGALRNVPVGGGCRRKNKRSKGSNSSNRSSKSSPNKPGSSIISNPTSANNNYSSSNYCPNIDRHTYSIGNHLQYPSLLFPPAPPPPTTSRSYSDYDVAFGTTNIKDAEEFHVVGNNNSTIGHNNNINNGFLTSDQQWKLPSLLHHDQQFPSTFLSNLEAPIGLYQFERTENVEIEPSTTLLGSGAFGNIASSDNHQNQYTSTIKMEETMDHVVGLSKNLFTGNSENNNEHFWEANNIGNVWSFNNVSISFACSSSAATHLL